MFALSTCWNAARHTDGKAMLEEVRALGFEHVELGHNTSMSLLPGIEAAVRERIVRIVAVHNFCPLPTGIVGMAPDFYEPSAADNRERDLALRYTLRTLDCAAMLGAKVVVTHLGCVPMRWPNFPRQLLDLYATGRAATPEFEQLRQKALQARERKKKKYFDQVCRVLDRLVPRLKELKLVLAMETRFGFHEIPSEDEADNLIRCYGSDALAYWFDNAHAQLKENMGLLQQEAVLERFQGRTAGMHLQDFEPPLRDHLPPGLGKYRFERLAAYVNDDMILSWEIHGDWDAKVIADSVDYLADRLRGAAAR